MLFLINLCNYQNEILKPLKCMNETNSTIKVKLKSKKRKEGIRIILSVYLYGVQTDIYIYIYSLFKITKNKTIYRNILK